MNTLLFTLEYPPFYGGVSKVYENIVNNWLEQGKIFVLNNNEGELINKRLMPRWLPAFFALYREIKKNKIDHILVGHILPLGTVAYGVAKIIGTKYSVFLHGMDFALALCQTRKKRITKLILTNAENIICANSYTAKLVQEFLSDEFKNKIKIVNPGIEIRATHNTQLITQLKEKYNLSNKIVLLSVGRLVKRKGVDMVLQSLPAVLKEVSDLVYIIAGKGEELENYRKQIINNNLQNNAIIINADNEEKNAWYDLCDIFIMPARMIGNDFEGFGIVYIEANLAGKPVIAGDSGGVRDAVIDGFNGLLINPEDVNIIANSIVKLAKNKELRKKLGAQGKERVINEFGWDKQAQKIYKIITKKYLILKNF